MLVILKLSFLTYQKSTGGPWILTCWRNQTSKPFSVFWRTALLKFQRVLRGKPFKITRSDLFVNFFNHLLLEKIAKTVSVSDFHWSLIAWINSPNPHNIHYWLPPARFLQIENSKGWYWNRLNLKLPMIWLNCSLNMIF